MADIRERTIVKSKVAAGVAQAVGEGLKLSQAVIVVVREAAEATRKAAEPMKKRLADLAKLSEPEHVAFTGGLEDERKAIGQRSKDAGHDKLADYFKSGTNGATDYYVYTSLSTWQTMSFALRLGWKPDSKMGWIALRDEAVAFKNAKIADKKGSNVPESDTERKAREAKELQQLVSGTVKAATGKLTEGEGVNVKLTDKGREALADVVAGIMQFASVEELEAVIQRLSTMKERAVKAREHAGKTIAKAAQSSATDPVVGNVGEKQTEKPVASKGKGGKRKTAKA